MSKPLIETKAFGFEFTWEEEQIQVKVSRARTHRDGTTKAELLITTTHPDYSPYLHQSQLNLISSQAKKSLAKIMGETYPEADWMAMVNQICFHTLEMLRRGSPVEEAGMDVEIDAPKYLVYPILPLNQPTVMFGEPSSGKSQMAQIIGIITIMPWFDNRLGLQAPAQSITPLWLDYETDRQTFAWQLKCVQEGMGLGNFPFQYRRCYLPLADDIEQLQLAIEDTKAQLLIVDHMGIAAGGKLKDDETAIRFFAALRELNITSLLLGHTSKDREQKKSIFGSMFFEAIPRSVWEVTKSQDVGEDNLYVGLFHRKVNLGRLQRPLGFRFSYNGTATTVCKQDASVIEEFVARMSLNQRILAALRQSPRNAAALVEDLGAKRNSVDQSLKRLRDKGIIVKSGDVWGIVHEEI